MKRKILTITAALLLVLVMAAPVFAAGPGSGNILCVDSSGCLSKSQASELNKSLDKISKEQKCEICIYTTDSFGNKTATEYADDYYDDNGYGYGKDRSGILLLLNLNTRDWAISTCGYGIDAFTDAGQEYIMDQILPALGDDDYNTAFSDFAALCDDFLTQANADEPYDKGNLPGDGINFIICAIIGIVVGIVIAFIVVGVDKAALKTVRRQPMAKNYQRQGSLKITGRSEQFMYKTVDREAREDSSDGGSSTHTSSSGTTHGGSSGKF